MSYDKNSPAYLVYFPESMKVERVRFVKFFDSPEFEDIGKNGQVEDEIDTMTSLHAIPRQLTHQIPLAGKGQWMRKLTL